MPSPYTRFPHVRGDLVTFVADDDVWLVRTEGGRAWRLTSDNTPAACPRLSPDGTQVAWTSKRHGVPEVFVTDVDGSDPRQLTHWGVARTLTRTWTSDGRVVAVSEAGRPAMNRTWAHALPTDGTPGEVLPYGHVDDLAYGPKREVLSATSASFGRDPAWWKRYRGGTAARLWLDRKGTGEFARLWPGHTASLVHPMFVGDRMLAVSDHDGVGRLYDLEDLSELAGHDFYVRHATSDGARVVYTAGGNLYLYEEGESHRLDVQLGGARSGRQRSTVAAADHRGTVAVDRTGRASAVEARGTVHWLAHDEGPARAVLATPGVRARVAAVTADAVVVVHDADGEDALEIVPTDSLDGEPTRVSADLGRVLGAAASPDGTTLAIASHDGRVLLQSLTDPSTEPRELDRAADGEVTGLTWSPDGSWLAWSHPGPEPLRQLKLAQLDTGTVIEATPLRFADTDPAFTSDGQHLAFLSVRSLDPVYDAFAFDLAFPGGCRPYLLPLAARTPSPFDPVVGGRPPEPDKSDDEETPGTAVDPEGLHERVVPFPVPAARYRRLHAVRGGVVWLKQPTAGELGDDLPKVGATRPRAALERFALDTRRTDTLADEVDDVWASGDGRRLVVADGGALRAVPSDHRVPDGPEGEKERVDIDLSRVRLHVDPVSEWHQMFDEAWRLMRDNYWRADMGGTDWAAVRDRYRPLVNRLGSHDDLVDLLWETQGELGTSHAYVQPKPPAPDQPTKQGLLGADLSPGDDGWLVDRVVPGESSDPKARSPLSAPGAGVRAGDAIVGVDGRPVGPSGPGPLLVGTAGKPVELTVRTTDGELRRVAVTPLADETPLRYQDWVAGRRAYVHEQSDGRLGYLHVPDMMSIGWAQLHRDLRLEMAREGLVLDVRENRGGHTSQLVVEKVAQRVIGWAEIRGRSPERYPSDAPRGPVVAVADEWAGSDGDIVNAAIQALGVGPVVGQRTWGGVVGIDMKYALVDGTVVTQPKYAFWLEGKGWAVENYGIDPDVEVVVTPQDRVAGRDPQLDEAIRIALEALEGRPASTRPDLPEV